ncbi:hypothetical protein ZIOFF_049175 [Zingiber officinale]|uniref:Arginyl-tRNA synthetase n=1 Tax=Zingiber officinale TaxID=94328 RepID=A0A8J5FSA2_ZINOF|nr:hypothetical protein ZIOFF_049175 [Zingiber officinale]
MFMHPCRRRRRRRPPSLVSTTISPQHCLLCDSLGLRKEVVSGGFGLRNLKLSRYFNLNPTSMKAIAKSLPESEMIESTSVAGPGFVNIKFSNKWISKHIQNMLVNGIEQWAPILSVRKAVVDFSSPNIAKEMHVGHLRSTIIMGDTLARMLEFSNVEVLRRNHVGDWGTQVTFVVLFVFSVRVFLN